MIQLSDFTTFREKVLAFPVKPGFIQTNASIAVRNNDIFVAVCCGDHFMDNTGHYMPVPAGTPFDQSRFSQQTIYLANLDENLDVVWSHEIALAPENVPVLEGPTYRGFRGFDSARLFVHDHKLKMAMCAMGTGAKPEAAQFVCGLTGHPSSYVDLKRIVPILPFPTYAEKNWMPEVAADGSLRFHYHLGTIATEDGTMYHPGGRADLMQMHGGSQVIPYAGGGLCIVHGFHPREGTMLRSYVHYFVVLNKDGSPIFCSEPFTITGRPIEIVTGMALHPYTGDVMISYGREGGDASMPDQEFPFIATLDPNDIFGRML